MSRHTSLQFASLCAAAFILAACAPGPARDLGYVCTTDCAHQCPDGNSGDSCRAAMQGQERQQENEYNYYYGYPSNYHGTGYDSSTYYDPDYHSD